MSGRRPVDRISPQQQRRLRLLFDRFWPDGGECDIDGLARAVARFVFLEELVYLPASDQLRRAGVVFYPVSPEGDVRALNLNPKGDR